MSTAAVRPQGPGRFYLLAAVIAGRPLAVAEAAPGDTAFTDGMHIFVTAGAPEDHQRREVLLQAVLLRGGSLDPSRLDALRGRPKVARRYLSLEGWRTLHDLAERVPLAASLTLNASPRSSGADESLHLARGRTVVPEPPGWFGELRPGRLLRNHHPPAGGPASDGDVRLAASADLTTLADNEADEPAPRSGAPRQTQRSHVNGTGLFRFLSKLIGMAGSPDEGSAGGELRNAPVRRSLKAGTAARPAPVAVRFVGVDDQPVKGVRGAIYPEWDCQNRRYRPDWCNVVEIPFGNADIAVAGVERDRMLQRRLARLAIGPSRLRRRPDGDDIDVDALVDLAADLRAGCTADESIYVERRPASRALSVLILMDASGSATDSDHQGRSVHEHQRRAAATLAATLEALGDRVAVYGFRSWGRGCVHLLPLKPFGYRFGAKAQAHLNTLEPAGYTRLGAAVRHAGEVLKAEGGTPRRLLVLLSDGLPYDDGYEGEYADSDVHKALEELRSDGIGRLCLSLGASTGPSNMSRVFGPASYASGAALAALSPRMDSLFLTALREQAAPRPTRRRRSRQRLDGAPAQVDQGRQTAQSSDSRSSQPFEDLDARRCQ